MVRSSWKVVGILGVATGALSFALLLRHALSFGWHPVLQLLFDFYDTIKNVALFPLRPFVDWIAGLISNYLNWNVFLHENWKDIFVIIFLYLGARSKSYWDTDHKLHAIFRLVLGLIAALFAGVFGGLWSDTGSDEGLKVGASVIFVIFVYELLAAIWGSLWYRKNSQTFLNEFIRYLNFSLPTVLLGLCCLALALLIGSWFPNSSELRLGTLSILLFSVTVAFYWAWRGWKFAAQAENRRMGEKRWERFERSSTTRISMLMLFSIVGGFWFALMNAGLNLLSN